MTEDIDWEIVEGERVLRKELHDRYGGNRERGISPSRKSPNIFLFSDPSAATKHGYADDLESDPVLYYGEGRFGDMELSHGNLSLLNHREEGRPLRLFRAYGREVEYLGEYELDPEEPYFWTTAPDSRSESPIRKAIVFRLRKI